MRSLMPVLIAAFCLAVPQCLADNSVDRVPVKLNPPSSASSLEGNVQGGAPVILQGLHDVGVSVHHLQEMLKGLLLEAQRQDMVVVSQPNVIGPMVIPAIPGPSGMMSMGYLPPRKKWVDYFMSQVEEIIPLLDHELNGLPRPNPNDTEVLQSFTEMFDAARGFNPPWSDLEAVTKGPDYKNDDIAKAVTRLYIQVDEFKKLKDKLYKVVKKEAKLQSKEKKDAKQQKEVDRKSPSDGKQETQN